MSMELFNDLTSQILQVVAKTTEGHSSPIALAAIVLPRGCFSAVRIWSHWWGQAKYTRTAKTVPERRKLRDFPKCCCQLWSGIHIHFEFAFKKRLESYV